MLLDLERVEQDAWSVVEMAKGIRLQDDPDKWLIEPNPRIRLQGLTEIRQTKVAQVQMAKELAIFRKDVIPRETFERMTAAIVKALQEFPEALRAVEDVMAELEL